MLVCFRPVSSSWVGVPWSTWYLLLGSNKSAPIIKKWYLWNDLMTQPVKVEFPTSVFRFIFCQLWCYNIRSKNLANSGIMSTIFLAKYPTNFRKTPSRKSFKNSWLRKKLRDKLQGPYSQHFILIVTYEWVLSLAYRTRHGQFWKIFQYRNRNNTESKNFFWTRNRFW